MHGHRLKGNRNSYNSYTRLEILLDKKTPFFYLRAGNIIVIDLFYITIPLYLRCEGFSIIVQLFCTDINRLAKINCWSENAYFRIPVFNPGKHQTDVSHGKVRTGFFISSCKPLINHPFIKAEHHIRHDQLGKNQ